MTEISDFQLTVVDCHGDDASQFLQGQLSNNIDALQTGQLQRNAYCNAKGRVLACLDVLKLGDNQFRLLLPDSLAGKIIQRLRMFVLRAKVQFDIQDKLAVSETSGQSLPGKGEFRLEDESMMVNVGLSKDLGLKISENLPSPLPQAWLGAAAIQGIPQVVAESSEMFLPQAINLDLTGGVSFTKGCYPGQEIVARLKYLGKLKQRMFYLEGKAGDRLPFPGEDITGDAKKVGSVVYAARPDNSVVQVLGILSLSALEPGEFATGAGAELHIKPLPYDIPELSVDV